MNIIFAIGYLYAVFKVQDRELTKYIKLLGISYVLMAALVMVSGSYADALPDLKMTAQLFPILCLLIVVRKTHNKLEKQLTEEEVLDSFLQG